MIAALKRTDEPSASDEALIERLWQGDELALNLLLRRYRPLVRQRARRFFIVGAEKEDVVQEAMIGLFKAMTSYDSRRGGRFATFAMVCITNELQNAIQSSQRFKHGPLNGALSLSAVSGAELLHEPDGRSVDPAHQIVSRDVLAGLREYCQEALSSLEYEALSRYLDGLSYDEIADALGREHKAVDNALRRARRKIAWYLAARESPEQ